MRGIVAAGLVIAMTALAGCTDDPQPRFEEPTESPSASESTSSAAAEPEPWEEKSKAGAVAFARHWVEVFNEAQTSGETAALRNAISARWLAELSRISSSNLMSFTATVAVSKRGGGS